MSANAEEKPEQVPVEAIVQSLADSASLDNFDRAFSNMRTNVCTCNCGKVYWDYWNTGYDWCEGERERLEADKTATGVGYSIDIIDIDGREYANACDCWKQRASKIICWLEESREAVVSLLRYERDRKMAEAKSLATVD